jgi:predicted transcriptional regulator
MKDDILKELLAATIHVDGPLENALHQIATKICEKKMYCSKKNLLQNLYKKKLVRL